MRQFARGIATVCLFTATLGCPGDTPTESQNEPPAATDDTYTTTRNTTLTVADGSTDLLANDDLGTPVAALASFGGGSLGGAVGANTAGATVSPLPSATDGSLTVNANGSFAFTPPTGFTGSFTFDYAITNAAGTSSATVSVTVVAAPTATDDAYSTTRNTPLSVPDGATDLLGNDDPGFPVATLTAFGGGDLGGAVTGNAAGATVSPLPSFADGSLTVNANGSLDFTPPTGFSGTFTFQYRLSNSTGTDDGTVTLTVNGAPAALDDGYNTPRNATLTVPDGATDLLGNDDTGFPLATLASFGGGSLGGAVTDNAAGATVSPLPSFADGSLTVNADGSLTFTPPTGFAGSYTFEYRLSNTLGTSDALVTIDVVAAPAALNDSYNTPANTQLVVPDGGTDLLSNDDLGNPPAALTSFGGGSLGGAVTDNAQGTTVSPLPEGTGSLTVNADGSVTFTPPTGFVGAYTFDYRLTNASGTSDGTVTIDVEGPPAGTADSYATPQNTTLNVPVGPSDLLANDALGFPVATLTSFGAGDLGGAVTDNTAGVTLSPLPQGSGSLTVNADGSFDFTPPGAFIGTYTFQYRLTNTLGTSDVTVSIDVTAPPAALSETYVTLLNTPLGVPAGPGDLLSNDALGFPPATLTSFGGGSLGGAVTDNAGGTVVSPLPEGSGSLTVGADGSLDFIPPTGFSGVYSFDYRLTNPSGTSDATVFIEIHAAPTPLADGYLTLHNTPITVPDGVGDLLDTDDLGFPLATMTSFGGGSLGGLVTDNAPGATVSPLPQGSGSLTVNADGSMSFTPPTGFSGLYTFDYRLTNIIGTGDGTVTITVEPPPVANTDTYPETVIGNVSVTSANVGAGPFSVIDNDVFPSPVTISAFDAASVQGGTVTMTTSGPDVGRFTYDPPAGYEGADSFTYTIANGSGLATSTATVNLTVAGMIWFIDGTAPAGNGRLSSPFNSLTAFDAVNNGAGNNPAPGDNIFLYEGLYGGPVTLLPDQRLIGQDATSSLATLAGLTPPASSAPFPVTSPGPPTASIAGAPDGIILGIDNFIHGLTLESRPTNGIAIRGAGFGTFTLTEVDVVGVGQALDLQGGALAANFGELSSTNSAASAINLLGVSGALTNTVPSVVAGATLRAVDLSTSSADVTYDADITNTTDRSILVVGQVGGTVTFLGDIDDTGDGIRLDNNAGGTIAFTGTLTLNTGAATAFDAVNGGTVTATGTNSTITTTDGTAVNLQGVTLAAAGLAFADVSKNGSGTGIALDAVGGPGALTIGAGTIQSTVTGVVVANSGVDLIYGGSIANTAGRSVEVTGQGAGTVTFAGSITDNSDGILLDGNAGGAIVFAGPLALSTGPNSAFVATNGGTVSATDPTSTIATTTGIGLHVENTEIAPPGLTFRSITVLGSTGAPGSGIILRSTGLVGGLTVTGDGASDPLDPTRGRTTVGVGGVIAPGSGGLILNTAGDGVFLENTRNVILRNMVIGDLAAIPGDPADPLTFVGDDGIEMIDVSNVVLDNVLISRTENDGISGATAGNVGLQILHSEILNAGDGVTDVALDFGATVPGIAPLAGIALIENSIIAAMAEEGVVVQNFLGTLELTVRNTLIANNDVATFCAGFTCDGDGLLISAGGTAAITLLVDNSEFQNIDGNSVVIDGDVSGSTNTTIQQTLFSSPNGPSALVLGSDANTNLLRMEDVDIQGQERTLVSLFPTRNLTATITATGGNNVWDGNSGAGAFLADGIELLADGAAATSPQVRVLIERTDILDVRDQGINIDCRDNVATAACDVTIRDNSITLGAINAEGIDVLAEGTYNVNLLIDNNSIITSGAGNEGIELDAGVSANLQATVTNNTVTTTSDDEIDVATLAAGAVMCADMRFNGIPPGIDGINITETAGTLAVSQANATAISADNANATVTVTGAIGFNATCVIPPLP